MASSSYLSTISIEETIIFLLINLIIVLLGIILWYFLWIKNKLVEIYQIVNNTLTYFSSRNLSLIMMELYDKISSFDTLFVLKTVGYEAYGYLLFQRRIISLLFSYFLFSILISVITMIIYKFKGIPKIYI